MKYQITVPSIGLTWGIRYPHDGTPIESYGLTNVITV